MEAYGPIEFTYANPVADAIATSDEFTSWLVSKTCFSKHAPFAVSLHRQQLHKRTKGIPYWWRNYFVGYDSCECKNCGGRETDILAIFDGINDFRFALHIEIKTPNDQFSPDQASNYRKRAECWAGRSSAPRTILPHDSATTVLLAAQTFLESGNPQVSQFDAVISFEEIASRISPYPAPD